MSENKARGPVMGGHRSRAMNSGEKAKDFKGAMKRLLKYMERYKIRFVLMFLFAIAGTIFNIVGPKILSLIHICFCRHTVICPCRIIPPR